MEENIQHIIELAKKRIYGRSFHSWIRPLGRSWKNAIMLANQPGVDLTVVRLICTYTWL
jgi:hypothetical protein